MKKNILLKVYPFLLCSLLIYSCKMTGPGGIFRKSSPHEKYGQLLTNAGLHSTALGREWFAAAGNSLHDALKVTVPYKEQGYFPSDKARANAVRFEARQGQKIIISFEKKPLKGFNVYVDLWEEKNNDKKLLAYADTGSTGFSYEIEKSGTYLIRLQPELLRSGEYTLTIEAGPSLAYPVRNGKAQSFWGAERDAGVRKHEGIDIFAPLRTPALAAARGTVTRVGLNNLGGKVVFMRPEGKSYNLYYAHLDEQLATEGSTINEGDTLGLIGTTGNARGGPPHLHFGIYTNAGAVDPYPFINQNIQSPEKVHVPLKNIGKTMRISSGNARLQAEPQSNSATLYNLPKESLIEITGATSSWYKVLLPNGKYGFIRSGSLRTVNEPLRQMRVTGDGVLLDRPDTLAAKMKAITSGSIVNVIGGFEDFYFVEAGGEQGWVKRKPQ